MRQVPKMWLRCRSMSSRLALISMRRHTLLGAITASSCKEQPDLYVKQLHKSCMFTPVFCIVLPDLWLDARVVHLCHCAFPVEASKQAFSYQRGNLGVSLVVSLSLAMHISRSKTVDIEGPEKPCDASLTPTLIQDKEGNQA